MRNAAQRAALLIVILVFFPALGAAGDEPKDTVAAPTLRHDPFSKRPRASYSDPALLTADGVNKRAERFAENRTIQVLQRGKSIFSPSNRILFLTSPASR